MTREPLYLGDDYADYIADHYGDCKLTQHECHTVNKCPGTRACPNWIPTKAKSWEELTELAKAEYASSRNAPIV